MKADQLMTVSTRIKAVATAKPMTKTRVSAARRANAAHSTPTPPAIYNAATNRVFSGLILRGICISAGTRRPVKPMPRPWTAAKSKYARSHHTIGAAYQDQDREATFALKSARAVSIMCVSSDLRFENLAAVFEQLEHTSSRKQLTGLLADLLRQVEAESIAEVAYLLQGRVAPLYEPVEFGLGERSIERAVA